MCTHTPLSNSLECYMDEMVECFEDFVKKSLFIVTLAVGALVGMLVYVVKTINDRNTRPAHGLGGTSGFTGGALTSNPSFGSFPDLHGRKRSFQNYSDVDVNRKADGTYTRVITDALGNRRMSKRHSDNRLLETHILDSRVMDNRVTDSRVADSRVADSSVANSSVANSSVANSRVADSRVADNRITDNLLSDNRAADSRNTDRRLTSTGITDTNVADSQVADNRLTDRRVTLTDNRLTDRRLTDSRLTDRRLSLTGSRAIDSRLEDSRPSVTEKRLVSGITKRYDKYGNHQETAVTHKLLSDVPSKQKYGRKRSTLGTYSDGEGNAEDGSLTARSSGRSTNKDDPTIDIKCSVCSNTNSKDSSGSSKCCLAECPKTIFKSCECSAKRKALMSKCSSTSTASCYEEKICSGRRHITDCPASSSRLVIPSMPTCTSGKRQPIPFRPCTKAISNRYSCCSVCCDDDPR